MYNSLIIKFNYKFIAIVLSLSLICCFLSSSIITVTKAEHEENISLPVIMYHHISEDYKALNDYVISPKELEEDFKYLRENGYTSILPKDLISYINGEKKLPENPVILTFDDGFESVYHYAYPLALKYGFSFVLAILGKEAEYYSQINDHNILYSYITWEEIKELSKSGIVEIANHTYDLHSTSPRKGVNIKRGESVDVYTKIISEDIESLQNMLKYNSDIVPSVFVYPYGFFCDEADKLIKSLGFKVSFSCTEGMNYINQSKDSLHLLKRYNRPHGIDSKSFFTKRNIN